MPDDRKYIRDYDDETLRKIEKHLGRTTFEGEPPWVKYWAKGRLRAINAELLERRQCGRDLITR